MGHGNPPRGPSRQSRVGTTAAAGPDKLAWPVYQDDGGGVLDKHARPAYGVSIPRGDDRPRRGRALGHFRFPAAGWRPTSGDNSGPNRSSAAFRSVAAAGSVA